MCKILFKSDEIFRVFIANFVGVSFSRGHSVDGENNNKEMMMQIIIIITRQFI